MNIIGISSHFHDSACCLLKNGKLVSAVEEERLSRLKHDKRIPLKAFDFCLQKNNLAINEIDCIAYYEEPQKKLSRQIWSTLTEKNQGSRALENFIRIDPNQVEYDIREVLGYKGKILYFDHHTSHAASSYYYSSFSDAAILTVDGVGEWATTTFGRGDRNGIEIFKSINYPDSVGLLYSTLTSFLGFEVNEGEYKVMGLAPYGQPKFASLLRNLFRIDNKGNFQLVSKFFDFTSSSQMYTHELSELLKVAPRRAESEISTIHHDIASSLQVVLEEILMMFAEHLHQITPSKNLCMAGGVALNCVANGKILKHGPFKNLFVQPAAGDSGSALGAAALAYKEMTGSRIKEPLTHVYLGPSYEEDELTKFINQTALTYKAGTEAEMLNATVERLTAGKVIGWFQGAMEFGPRALGCRSILADPRGNDMRDRINALVKKREAFRPFAPAVLFDKVNEHFDIDHESPFMLETCQVRSVLDLPAITHVDNSARVQTVKSSTNRLFYNLISLFEINTKCPILLNTSFNLRGEPIVSNPIDALICFIRSKLDTLVLGNFVIDRDDIPAHWYEWFHKSHVNQKSAISHDVYSFL